MISSTDHRYVLSVHHWGNGKKPSNMNVILTLRGTEVEMRYSWGDDYTSRSPWSTLWRRRIFVSLHQTQHPWRLNNGQTVKIYTYRKYMFIFNKCFIVSMEWWSPEQNALNLFGNRKSEMSSAEWVFHRKVASNGNNKNKNKEYCHWVNCSLGH